MKTVLEHINCNLRYGRSSKGLLDKAIIRCNETGRPLWDYRMPSLDLAGLFKEVYGTSFDDLILRPPPKLVK